MSAAPRRMERAELVAAIQTALRIVHRDPALRFGPNSDLRRRLGISGRDLCRACELLEEACGVVLLQQDLVEFALGGATVDRLVALLRDKQDLAVFSAAWAGRGAAPETRAVPPRMAEPPVRA